MDFNQALVQSTMEKNRKKMRIFGLLEIIVGGLMLISCFFSETPVHPLYYVMGFALPLVGAFSLCYHSLIFPGQMKRNVHKLYNESEYLAGELSLSLFEDRVEDSSGKLMGSTKWQDVERGIETGLNFIVMLNFGRGLILPKSAVGQDEAQVSSFLKGVLEEQGKPYQKNETVQKWAAR